MTDPSTQKAFLERHPDVTAEELDALFEKRGWKRAPIIIVALLSLLLLAVAVLAFRVDYVIDQHADEIASELADREIKKVEVQLEIRTREGRALASDFFAFLVDLIEESRVLSTLEVHWGNASKEADSLLLDLRSMGDTPLDSGKRLWKTGPSRLEAIITHASAFVLELEAFVPQMIKALRNAGSALQESENRVEAIFDALDALMLPLIESNTELIERWRALESRMITWSTAVSTDIETIRTSLDGDRLSREFITRISRAVFGL